MARRPGRPSKFSPERAAVVLDALRAGSTKRAAAAYAGVSEDSLARWEERDIAGFADSITRAIAESEISLVATIRQQAQGGTVVARETSERVDAKGRVTQRVTRETVAPPDWRAAAWILCRRWPEDWGDRIEVRQERLLELRLQTTATELGLPYEVVLAEAQRQALPEPSRRFRG